MAADVKLYELLDECKEEGLEPPAETKHITCTPSLALHLSRNVLIVDGTPIDPRAVYGAYGGMAVKAVWHIVNAKALKIRGLEERDAYLRRRARKRREAA